LNALPAVLRLSKKYDVQMPIIEAVNAVVANKIKASEVVQLLMSRDLKAENTVKYN
jgi:glycerol-3-phosphate dehydrogenase (NAD(P)+)